MTKKKGGRSSLRAGAMIISHEAVFRLCARARARFLHPRGGGGGDLGGGYTIITPSREVEETSWTCAGTAQSEDRRVDDSIVASLPLLSGCSCVSLSLSRLSTCLLSLSLSLSLRAANDRGKSHLRPRLQRINIIRKHASSPYTADNIEDGLPRRSKSPAVSSSSSSFSFVLNFAEAPGSRRCDSTIARGSVLS